MTLDFSMLKNIFPLDASTVKWIAPIPCIGLSESDSKLYTNFEFSKGKNHKHFKNTLIYKVK